MNREIKKLMDIVLAKFGGVYSRDNLRNYWTSPSGERFHLNTVFLRRMAAKPAPVKEVVDVVQPKQEIPVNGIPEPRPERPEPKPRVSEKVAETPAKVEEKRISSEAPKKKKTDRKKETKPKVVNEPQQGQEVKESE